MTPGDPQAPDPWARLAALPWMPSVDVSYERLIGTLPPGLRGPARGLPHRLGVAKTPDGGWQDFVCLHPNRELPVYAAETDGTVGLAPERLRGYVRAHHFGGFTWLLRDRVADGQVPADAALLALSRALGDRWRGALLEACGDRDLVGRVIAAVTRRWQRGTRRERAALRAGGMRPALYASLVRDKLRWIAAASTCLVSASGPDARDRERAARARAFQRAHDLFLLGLQAIDDVNDAAEDRALHGHDVPEALGCSAGALLRVAPKLLERASAVAAASGFLRLALWLAAFAKSIAPLHRDGDQVADELDAIGIAGEMELATDADEDADEGGDGEGR